MVFGFGEKKEQKEKDPGVVEMEKNMEIWEEIRNGKIENERVSSLTLITDEIAEVLSKTTGGLYLNSLVFLSDISAEHLSHHTSTLYLNHLSSISDAVAEHLSHHRGGDIDLRGLEYLSDNAAKYFAEVPEEDGSGSVLVKGNNVDNGMIVQNKLNKFRASLNKSL